MNPETKIYVAGHTGMVGSALVRRLEARGYRRIVGRTLAELDLRRQADVEALFAAERPAVVFLAAATVGGIVANSTRPAEFLYDNLLIAAHVIEAARRSGVKRLVNFGSSCIYPKHAPQPLREEHLLTGPLEPTNEAYAVAKIAALKLCAHYRAQYGCDFYSLMPTNLYGPNDTYDLVQSHVLPALVRKFHLAKLLAAGDLDGLRRDLARRPLAAGCRLPAAPAELPLAAIAAACAGHGVAAEAVTLWGTGTPRREFLHVNDLAAAAVHLAETASAEAVGDFINVGSGEDGTIAELAETVRGIVGFAGAIRYDASKPDGTPRKLLDVSRLRALGWAPAIPLAEGIRTVYRAYQGEE
ncbi:MAG TPA: GDP-L-fucose synthase [Acidobacteriota bacterium]|nr:GDP-L-fucose synthase [Acidobacteriota bacterium]HQM64955.1 GDP-L-fucose synthase [Acidobacteriota bacterium]